MIQALGILVLASLLAALVLHALLVRALAKHGPSGKLRLVLDLLFPPLALLDGFTTSARREATLAAGAFTLHAVLVIVAHVLSR